MVMYFMKIGKQMIFLFVFLVKDIVRRTEMFTLVMRSEIPRNFNKQKFDSSVTAVFCNEP